MMNKISKLDWIQGGFRTLTSDGHLAIKAEVIARDLGVSKGSFYWHFDNVAAFKIAMLEHWVAQGTDGIMSQVRNADAEPSDQLRSLVNTITAELNAPYGGLLAESAIRNWARFDPQVLLSVRRVDQSRLKFLASLFRRAGGSAEISRRFANLFYSGLIGLEYLTHERLAKLKTDLPVLLDLLLESINPGEN